MNKYFMDLFIHKRDVQRIFSIFYCKSIVYRPIIFLFSNMSQRFFAKVGNKSNNKKFLQPCPPNPPPFLVIRNKFNFIFFSFRQLLITLFLFVLFGNQKNYCPGIQKFELFLREFKLLFLQTAKNVMFFWTVLEVLVTKGGVPEP